jgi:cyanophycin synthetase
VRRRWLEVRHALAWARHAVARRVAARGDGTQRARREFYARMWGDAAAAIGAALIELEDGFYEVRLGDRATRLRQDFVMLDDPVTLQLAGHKPLVHRLLSAAGLPVPPHRRFTLTTIDAAEEFLRLGVPCVVKPAVNSGAGAGVTTHVVTRRQLALAAVQAALHSKCLLIERQIAGDAYRLLYLHGRLLQAVWRRPPRVVGDGRSTIRQLIEAENARRAAEWGGEAAVTRLHVDLDMELTLRGAGLSLGDVPEAGQMVIVKTVVNDNGRRGNTVVTDRIGDALRADGACATAVLGTALAAVDIITPDPCVALRRAGGVIVEVNTTPGLHHHYNVAEALSSPPQAVAVPVLKSLLGLTD